VRGMYTFVYYISACTKYATVTLWEYSKVNVVLPLSPFGTMCAQEGMSNFKSFFWLRHYI
jgi:hypothetical protein